MLGGRAARASRRPASRTFVPEASDRRRMPRSRRSSLQPGSAPRAQSPEKDEAPVARPELRWTSPSSPGPLQEGPRRGRIYARAPRTVGAPSKRSGPAAADPLRPIRSGGRTPRSCPASQPEGVANRTEPSRSPGGEETLARIPSRRFGVRSARRRRGPRKHPPRRPGRIHCARCPATPHSPPRREPPGTRAPARP